MFHHNYLNQQLLAHDELQETEETFENSATRRPCLPVIKWPNLRCATGKGILALGVVLLVPVVKFIYGVLILTHLKSKVNGCRREKARVKPSPDMARFDQKTMLIIQAVTFLCSSIFTIIFAIQGFARYPYLRSQKLSLYFYTCIMFYSVQLVLEIDYYVTVYPSIIEALSAVAMLVAEGFLLLVFGRIIAGVRVDEVDSKAIEMKRISVIRQPAISTDEINLAADPEI